MSSSFVPVPITRANKDVREGPNPVKIENGKIKKEVVVIDKALQRGTKARVKLVFETVADTQLFSHYNQINEQIAKTIFGNYKEYFHVGEPLPGR